MQLAEAVVMLQTAERWQGWQVNEVCGKVKLPQGLALLQVLHFGYVVEGKVELLQLLHGPGRSFKAA